MPGAANCALWLTHQPTHTLWHSLYGNRRCPFFFALPHPLSKNSNANHFSYISWSSIIKMVTNPIANHLMNLLWRVANNANHQMVESRFVKMCLWRTAISVTLTKELLTCISVCLLMWKSKSIYRAFARRCRIWLVCRKTFPQCHLFI